jgi:hypothetical protein
VPDRIREVFSCGVPILLADHQRKRDTDCAFFIALNAVVAQFSITFRQRPQHARATNVTHSRAAERKERKAASRMVINLQLFELAPMEGFRETGRSSLRRHGRPPAVFRDFRDCSGRREIMPEIMKGMGPGNGTALCVLWVGDRNPKIMKGFDEPFKAY